jgi:hypothetical protein
MRFCSWQSSAELALFARLRTASGTTNRQRFLLSDFHDYTMRGRSQTRWSIVTIARSYRRGIIFARKSGCRVPDDGRWRHRRQWQGRRIRRPLGVQQVTESRKSGLNEVGIHDRRNRSRYFVVREASEGNGRQPMGSCLRVASSEHDSHPFQATPKIKVAQVPHGVLKFDISQI